MSKAILMIIFMIRFTLNAQSEIYGQLHAEIKQDIDRARQTEGNAFFLPFKTEINALDSCLKAADAYLDKGQDIDARGYLEQLRRCEKKSKKFDANYINALREAIAKKDQGLFKLLIETNPRVLQRERWVAKSVSYYKESRAKAPFKAGDRLLQSSVMEEKYRQTAAMELERYETNVEVLSYAQASRSRDKDGKVRTFFLGYKKDNGYTRLIAENRNIYPVTLSVKLTDVQNYTVERPLLYHIEVDPHSKIEVMNLQVKNSSKRSSFRSLYSWVMGRQSARENAGFLYALPFKESSAVIVSQGFNGEATHTGRSRYAVDFAASVGTGVYAARGGKVIATEASFDKGGLGMAYGQFANYITIEHTDGTMAKYYHLKQNGVNVKVGQYVSKGQFIGLSGNTGYSSGPHLHFGVYKVDSDYENTVTLPIKFQTNAGVVDFPKKGDIYRAVR